MRTVLAIDPGTATTGYAVLRSRSKSEEPKLLSYGCIITSARQSLPKRLVTLARDLRKIMSRYYPKELAVERLFFAKNAKTAIAVGQARGVVLLIGAERKLEISEYTPLQVKQALTGYGQATKLQVQRMVKTVLRLAKIPSPDDAADAIAVGLCHLQTNRKVKGKKT